MAENIFSPCPYWPAGLHDAEIVTVEEQTLTYDVRQKDPIRNCLVLRINACGAMFDTYVKEIRLYNYKILSGVPTEIAGAWWLSDTFKEENGKCILTLSLQNSQTFPDKFTFIVRFETAEVIRK